MRPKSHFIPQGWFLPHNFFFFFFAVPAGRWPPALLCRIGSQVLPAERRVGPLRPRTCPPQEQLPGRIEIGWRRSRVGTKATAFPSGGGGSTQGGGGQSLRLHPPSTRCCPRPLQLCTSFVSWGKGAAAGPQPQQPARGPGSVWGWQTSSPSASE